MVRWWDDTVLQTQDSKIEPWRSEAEHATSRSRRLPTILTFTRGWGRNIFCFFQTAETGNRTPNSGVKGSGANHYPRAPALCLAEAIHNFKWVKIILIWHNGCQLFSNISNIFKMWVLKVILKNYTRIYAAPAVKGLIFTLLKYLLLVFIYLMLEFALAIPD